MFGSCKIRATNLMLLAAYLICCVSVILWFPSQWVRYRREEAYHTGPERWYITLPIIVVLSPIALLVFLMDDAV